VPVAAPGRRGSLGGMDERIDRRTALSAFGAVSLGALLAACSSDDGGGAATGSSTSSTNTTNATGTSVSSATSDLFDNAASCTLTPEETEGPYYFDADAIRSDIREDRPGVPLRVALRVMDNDTCTPVSNAVVDIWHCDATGIYSGFEAASTGAGGGAPGGGQGSGPTDDETYLRGAQVTNADGIVEFVTVYPGWYRGRTVHIHAKVHVDNATVLTTQVYFDEAVTDTVYSEAPYSDDAGRDTFNDDDSIFDDELVLTLSEDGDGYLGVMSFNVA
jgi:protocatechuate 3,4-dioxygenase beta subunit